MTTEVTKESILSQIDDLVSKSTFSLDALNAVNSLKETLQQLQTDYEKLKNVNERWANDNNRLITELESVKSNLRDQTAIVKELRANEEKATKAIYDAEKFKEVAGTWEKALNIVFKPTQVRENIYGSMTDHGSNGVASSSQRSSTVVRDFE